MFIAELERLRKQKSFLLHDVTAERTQNIKVLTWQGGGWKSHLRNETKRGRDETLFERRKNIIRWSAKRSRYHVKGV